MKTTLQISDRYDSKTYWIAPHHWHPNILKLGGIISTPKTPPEAAILGIADQSNAFVSGGKTMYFAAPNRSIEDVKREIEAKTPPLVMSNKSMQQSPLVSRPIRSYHHIRPPLTQHHIVKSWYSLHEGYIYNHHIL